MKTISRLIINIWAILIFTIPCLSQEYIPTKENLNNREWFQDAKFGLFIHWGIYSTLAEQEWVMETRKIDIPTYEKIAPFFNPTAFNAEEWVLMAKSAGMKYITITSKHHDGFAMYDSKVSDWDIMDRSPFKRDVLKELAEACRKHNMKLFFYYSQLDWHHPDYFPRGGTGKNTGRKDEGDWDKYIDYMNAQLSELLTNYGDLGGIWFDGWWDNKKANWRLDETYKHIHLLQPSTMIGSNHHQTPMPGEDFQMFEKDLPGHNTTGFSGEATIGKLPIETAETMAERWGFSLQDKAYKSSTQLIHYLVKAAGYNSNFLLNVGPMPNGKIQPEFIDTLKVVGKWMDTFGETVYGTRGGPIEPQPWGVSTQKKNTIYVHILDYDNESLLLHGIEGRIGEIQSFDSNKSLKYEVSNYGLLIDLKNVPANPVDRILIITLR